MGSLEITTKDDPKVEPLENLQGNSRNGEILDLRKKKLETQEITKKEVLPVDGL